ncbi:hypothetical protein Taro_056414 [Colocasia esculenta]|uniref:Uncharacterized protein n=1 Tax=Colocasia esculenta TaxID=4460 RepID=A0A843XWL5_COLES|nr:hypothetical protein [Colocasia esculenta]
MELNSTGLVSSPNPPFSVYSKSFLKGEPAAVDRPSLLEPQIAGSAAICRQPAHSCRQILSQDQQTMLWLLLSVDSHFLAVDTYQSVMNWSFFSQKCQQKPCKTGTHTLFHII